MNSRQKGKVGEREFAALLRHHGFDARRGQQFAGGADSPDVVSEELGWIHFEVKRCERIDLRSWIGQAAGDAGGKRWVLALRWNHGPWLFLQGEEFFMEMLRTLHQNRSTGEAGGSNSAEINSGRVL